MNTLNWIFGLHVSVFLLAFFWYCRSRFFTLVGPIFWYLVFHGIVFVGRPLVVIYFNFTTVFEYMRLMPTEAALVRALLVSDFALLVFIPTTLWGGASEKWQFREIGRLTQADVKAFGLLGLVALPMIVYSMVTVLQGGVVGERVGGTYIFVNTTGYIVEAQVMFLPLAIFFVIWRGFRPTAYIPLVLYLMYVTIFVRTRWQLVGAALAVYFLYVMFRAGRIVLWPIAICVPLIAVTFALKGLDRGVYLQALNGEGFAAVRATTEKSWKEKLDTQDFANFDYLTYIVTVVPEATQTYTYFTQWLQLFTEPIPRILWENKPIGAPITYFDLNDYGQFIGLTRSVVGDGWMSYGWIGVLVTVGGTGFILGRFHRYACKYADDPLICVAYAIGVSLLFQLYRDGGISIFKFALFAVLPVMAARILRTFFFAATPEIPMGARRPIPPPRRLE